MAGVRNLHFYWDAGWLVWWLSLSLMAFLILLGKQWNLRSYSWFICGFVINIFFTTLYVLLRGKITHISSILLNVDHWNFGQNLPISWQTLAKSGAAQQKQSSLRYSIIESPFSSHGFTAPSSPTGCQWWFQSWIRQFWAGLENSEYQTIS